jgi:subtilisin-like proprotein convertase family protein
LSFDVIDDDLDPTPPPGAYHGTAVAGVVGARDNNFGVRGVAPRSLLAGLRLLGGAFNDFDVSRVLAYGKLQTDIYVNSWGPPDTGVLNDNDIPQSTFGGPLQLFQILDGTTIGRGGLGDVYVWAAGNGGDIGDNSNYDALANFRLVIAVGAVGHDGIITPYSEPGANVFIVGPSSDGYPVDPATIGIVTTDLTGNDGLSPGDYTDIGPFGGPFGFGGTSSAAAAVAGVVALVMEANPTLTYRDIHQILAESARLIDPTHPDWRNNGGAFNFMVNHWYGFGMVDAEAAVRLAQKWTHVLPERRLIPNPITLRRPVDRNGITSSITLSTDLQIERVEVVVDATLVGTVGTRGTMEIELVSPNGTVSRLAEQRADAGGNYINWVFSSIQHWGESTQGTWTIRVRDRTVDPTLPNNVKPIFNRWQVRFYGVDNYAPRANDDDVTTPEDTPLVFSPLANDVELDGGSFDLASLTIVSSTTNGTLSYNPATGFLTYTPNLNYFGPDMFTYTVRDNQGAISRVATVNITVTSVNDPPVAGNDAARTQPLQSVQVDVLANDFDVDIDNQIDPSTVQIVQLPLHGDVNVLPSGVIVYSPGPSFTSLDTFAYTVSDTAGGVSNAATVTISKENLAPLAVNDSVSMNKNGVGIFNVLANDSDPDGFLVPGTVTIGVRPVHGTAVVNVSGQVVYTPQLNFFGSDALTYTVRDDEGAVSNVALVTINVLNVGAPAASDQEVVVPLGGARVTGVLNALLGGGPLSAILVSPPTHGSLILDPQGTFSYTVGPSFPGIDRFTYKVTDGTLESNVATVTIVAQEYVVIRRLYNDLLGRGATEGEIGFWFNVLRRTNRQTVINSFLNSTEYRSNQIHALYNQLLGRGADPLGLTFWLDRMARGNTLEQITADITASPEYFSRNGNTNDGFARALYRDLLGRQASQSDVNFVVSQLNGGSTRQQVATQILFSNEYAGNLVRGLYLAYLRRNGEPSGIVFWQQVYQSNRSRIPVQLGLLGSNEYWNRLS